MKNKVDIKNFYGRILGSITTDDTTGDAMAQDFYGRILGYYYAKKNHTVEFSGRILAQGNVLVSLIYKAVNKK